MWKRKKSNKSGVGHPAYVYGQSSRAYKYLAFTHTPEKGKETEYERLHHNIDPKDPTACYVGKKPRVDRINAFRQPDKQYQIHPDDLPTIKKYKK